MIKSVWMCGCDSSSYKVRKLRGCPEFMWCFCVLQLLLAEGGLHADVNGDGVLDHVQVRILPYG